MILGIEVGRLVGPFEGDDNGLVLGETEGHLVDGNDGFCDGLALEVHEGPVVGPCDGDDDGLPLGVHEVGPFDGLAFGMRDVGPYDGDAEGVRVHGRVLGFDEEVSTAFCVGDGERERDGENEIGDATDTLGAMEGDAEDTLESLLELYVTSSCGLRSGFTLLLVHTLVDPMTAQISKPKFCFPPLVSHCDRIPGDKGTETETAEPEPRVITEEVLSG